MSPVDVGHVFPTAMASGDRNRDYLAHNLDTPQRRIDFAKEVLGSQCPDPRFMDETKPLIGDTVFYPVCQWTTELKCHQSV